MLCCSCCLSPFLYVVVLQLRKREFVYVDYLSRAGSLSECLTQIEWIINRFVFQKRTRTETSHASHACTVAVMEGCVVCMAVPLLLLLQDAYLALPKAAPLKVCCATPGCKRPPATPYKNCCRTCDATGGTKHGPACEQVFSEPLTMSDRSGNCSNKCHSI